MTVERTRVPVIGFVGGVGSGKSSVAKELGKIRRVEVVDGDQAGHQVLKEESVKEQIRRTFGMGVFDEHGEIDRRQLGRLVFGSDEKSRAARSALEAIVHPRIADRLRTQIAAAKARSDVDVVVLDAAVLLEAGWRNLCDRIIFVDTPDEERFERVARSRGWTRDQLRSREESQYSLEQKRKEADDVIDNSASGAGTKEQLEAILSKMDLRRPT